MNLPKEPQQTVERKNEDKVREKHLTVVPYRLIQETPKHTLKQTLKIQIKKDTVTPLDTQIAGHGSENSGERGMLMHKDGFVLKPVQAPPKGLREIGFYQAISGSNDPVDMKFCKFTAKFFGTETVESSNFGELGVDYLVLENLTQGFDSPCVMDVKIGAKTYGPDATELKKCQEDAKYVGTKIPHGFSILGIIVGMRRWTKNFGRQLKENKLHEVLENYFNTAENDAKAASAIASCFVEQLEEIQALFQQQTKFHIYGSSLLFVYDYSAFANFSRTGDMQSLRSSVCVKLIDFAHVFPGDGKLDENYIFGLRNLTKLFSAFANKNLD